MNPSMPSENAITGAVRYSLNCSRHIIISLKAVRDRVSCSFMCITVNGAWSCWSSWSQCSVGCGGGHYQRTRSCNSPAPSTSGDICIGLHTEEALCNTHPCDGKVTQKFKILLCHVTTAPGTFITPPGRQSFPTPCNFCAVPFAKLRLSSFPNE